MDNRLVIIIFIAITIQGTLIFRDAKKSGVPHPWIWGIIGLLNIPCSLIFYIIYKKLILKKRQC